MKLNIMTEKKYVKEQENHSLIFDNTKTFAFLFLGINYHESIHLEPNINQITINLVMTF